MRRRRKPLIRRSHFLRLLRLALCRRVSGAPSVVCGWSDEALAYAWDHLMTVGERQ